MKTIIRLKLIPCCIEMYKYIIISVVVLLDIGVILSGRTPIIFITPPRHRGGVIFSLQFVCVSICLCVCLSVCVCVRLCSVVNKIPAERMIRFGRGFC